MTSALLRCGEGGRVMSCFGHNAELEQLNRFDVVLRCKVRDLCIARNTLWSMVIPRWPQTARTRRRIIPDARKSSLLSYQRNVAA